MQLARKFRQRAWFGVLEYQLASSAILSRQLKSQSNYQLNCHIADAIYKFEKKTGLISQLAVKPLSDPLVNHASSSKHT